MLNKTHDFSTYLNFDAATNQKIRMILRFFKTYLNGAILQIQRFNKNRKYLNKHIETFTKNTEKYQLKLYLDAHFYFSCIGMINKLFGTLQNKLKDNDIAKLHKKFKSNFSKEIRDNFEHLNERIIGKKFNNDIEHISDFFNFYNKNVSFNKKSYPLGNKQIDDLKKTYKELSKIFLQKFVNTDTYDYFKQNDKNYRKILKAYKIT